ncbi:MAG: N-acetylmuramoyl-L-alanine amidase [Chloroflexota bacterium]
MEKDLNPQVSEVQETPEMESEAPPMSADRPRNGFSTWRIIQTVISAAFVVATLFTIWMPSSLVSISLGERMSEAILAENLASDTLGTPESALDAFPNNRIGIVVGHLGYDSGAVCSDGLQEVDVNNRIATLVQKRLIELGYQVDLLEEFDERLNDYRGIVLLSIHADSCNYINDLATGFKIAAALSEKKFDESSRLLNCISERYGTVTGLPYHYQSVTNDMTYYHAFNEINPGTTAAIIETGFLNLDRQILTENPDLIAEGIVAGIQCFINNEVIKPTPITTITTGQ